MKRREFTLLTGASFLIGVAGCNEESKPSPTATLFNNDKVNKAVKELIEFVALLDEDIAKFESDDWRDVVPQVRNDTDAIADAVSELRKALGYESS